MTDERDLADIITKKKGTEFLKYASRLFDDRKHLFQSGERKAIIAALVTMMIFAYTMAVVDRVDKSTDN